MAPISDNPTPPRCPVFGRCGGCDLQHLTYEAQLGLKEAQFRDALARTIDLSSVEILPIIPAPSPWHYRHRVHIHRAPTGEVGFFAKGTHEFVPVETCYIVHPAITDAMATLRRPSERMDRIELVWDEKRQTIHHYLEGAANRYFTQVNPEQNQRLQQLVLDWIAPKTPLRILELYAGAGNFTIPLARRGATITAVESSPEAIAVGIKESHSLPITWIERGTRHALKELLQENLSWDVVLMDPPRAGLGDVATLVAKLKSPRLIYISCNPSALAKDLRTFTAHGYSPTRLQPLDMFPQTMHLETVVELHHYFFGVGSSG